MRNEILSYQLIYRCWKCLITFFKDMDRIRHINIFLIKMSSVLTCNIHSWIWGGGSRELQLQGLEETSERRGPMTREAQWLEDLLVLFRFWPKPCFYNYIKLWYVKLLLYIYIYIQKQNIKFHIYTLIMVRNWINTVFNYSKTSQYV